MKHILAGSNLEVVQQYAWSDVLLAFDFDGTLAPIVSDPERALVSLRTRDLLTEVAVRFPTVIISGRNRADVLKRVRGVPLAAVIGNHGAETFQRASEPSARVVRWAEDLRARLAELPNAWVETKAHSVAVHYRQCRAKGRARRLIEGAVASLEGARVLHGKQVVNLVPSDLPHKGTALEAAMLRLRCDTALYVGDDASDEDVFALDRPGRLLTVRVGRSASSRASYFLNRRAEVDRLLRVLAAMRAPQPAGRSAASGNG